MAPSPADLQKRVEALEAHFNEAGLVPDSLPLRPLIRRLEADWQPDLPENFRAGQVASPRFITSPETNPRVELSDAEGLLAVDKDGNVLFQVPFDQSLPTILAVPYASISDGGGQNFTGGVEAQATLDTVVADSRPGGSVQGEVASSRLRVQRDGVYLVSGRILWDVGVWTGGATASTPQPSYAAVHVNGAEAVRGPVAQSYDTHLVVDPFSAGVFEFLDLSAGDLLTLHGLHSAVDDDNIVPTLEAQLSMMRTTLP